MYQDKSTLDYIGSGNLNAIIPETLSFGDDVSACINLASDIGPMMGEDPKKATKKLTYEIDNDGGTSELRLILRRYVVDETGAALATSAATGSSVSDTGGMVIDGVRYSIGSGGVITHNIDGNTYDTLHDFVVAINALPGFVASVLHALTTQDTGNNDYIDVDETVLPNAQSGGADTLFRDVSETFTMCLRIGLPRPGDRNPLQLLSIKGTSAGVTNGTLKLIFDNDADYVADASHQKNYVSETLAAAQTSYLDNNVLEGQTIRGSVVLEVKSDDLTACNMNIHYRQALAM